MSSVTVNIYSFVRCHRKNLKSYPSLSASPPSSVNGFWLGLGEEAWVGTTGVLRPVGIGGRMVLTLDPGRLSEEGDTATGC